MVRTTRLTEKAEVVAAFRRYGSVNVGTSDGSHRFKFFER